MSRATWRAVWIVVEMNFKQTMTDGFILFAILFQPLIIALMGLWMLGDKGADYMMFVIVGSGLTGLWSGLLFVCGNSLNMERWSGTLEMLVGVPTSLTVVVLGKNLGNIIQSLISMVAAYVLAALLFGYQLQITQPMGFGVSVVLSVLAFISFGLLLAPLFVLNPGVRHWQNAMEFPVYILCGFLFPIALLPHWTTPLSYALPPYWAAVALHGTSSANLPFDQIALAWIMLIVESAICLLIAGWLFKKMLVKARTDATLDME